MTSANQLELMRAALHATLTGDVAACERLFTRDISWSSPTLAAASRDELETVLSSRSGALSGIEIVIDRFDETGDTALAAWHATAAHDRAFVVPADTDLSASGRVLELEGSTTATFAGNRIAAIRHDFDEEALLRQLRG